MLGNNTGDKDHRFMAIRLSIIIPCYNSAKTIIRCLDSIYSLPLPESDFEVIAVNDGSTDETQNLLEEYARHHTQLTVIRHLVNRNLGAARNTGLSAARGRAIAFVDSDDEIMPPIVKALSRMENKGLDLVAMSIEKVDGSQTSTQTLPYSPEEVFSGIRLQEEHPFWGTAVWSYLFSKALIDRVHYPFVEGAFFEDADYVYNHLYHAEKVSYCEECSYRFITNPSSITHTFSPRHVYSYAFLGIRMLSIYERLIEKDSIFAKSILEGGSFNIKQALRRLFRLDSIFEVNQFYSNLDARVNRESLQHYREPAYCWTFWTIFGLKHRVIATWIVGLFISLGGKRVFNRRVYTK